MSCRSTFPDSVISHHIPSVERVGRSLECGEGRVVSVVGVTTDELVKAWKSEEINYLRIINNKMKISVQTRTIILYVKDIINSKRKLVHS